MADGWETDDDLVRSVYTLHLEDDDFGQAGALVRDVFNDAQRSEFVDQMAGSLLGCVHGMVLERIRLLVQRRPGDRPPHRGEGEGR